MNLVICYDTKEMLYDSKWDYMFICYMPNKIWYKIMHMRHWMQTWYYLIIRSQIDCHYNLVSTWITKSNHASTTEPYSQLMVCLFPCVGTADIKVSK